MNKEEINVERGWTKMILNSFYGFPPIVLSPFVFFDENKALQITEEGKKNLRLIQKTRKNER